MGDYLKARALEEMRHAEGLIERIVFFDSIPEVNVALTPQLGANVQQQFEIDLKDEKDAVIQYNGAVKVCVQATDNGTRELFERMVKDEERHVDILEAKLHSIDEMGIQNYLAQQLQPEK